mmetsp:Transcript_24521/g.67708  ORF Transcript_24521/g.67708 Transcript_24521/m.67708 type:complete len:200 (+) Transcript_24521:1023-1622(+)
MDDVHGGGFREFLEVLSRRHVVQPLVAPGVEIEFEIVKDLREVVVVLGIDENVLLGGAHENKVVLDDHRLGCLCHGFGFWFEIGQEDLVRDLCLREGDESNEFLSLGQNIGLFRDHVFDLGNVCGGWQVVEFDLFFSPLGDQCHGEGGRNVGIGIAIGIAIGIGIRIAIAIATGWIRHGDIGKSYCITVRSSTSVCVRG